MSEVKVQLVTKRRSLPDETTLGFGKIFTDHMFTMDYETGKGWHNPCIEPYKALAMMPATMTLHYGQAIFEGIKAFKTQDNRIVVFRPKDYLARFNRSAEILCIPQMDINTLYSGLKQLLEIEKNWVPSQVGTALYIRPLVIAMDEYVGVKTADTYKLIIMLSPVGAYYDNGFDPVSLKVEDKYVRACHGGLGEAKTPANYAASLRAGEVAHQEGFSQVLWLDAVERKYIEEVGAMNIFFKINGELITPALTGSILGGMTRRTVLEIAHDWGMKATERVISIDEVYDAHAKGQLEEIFGTGTAAVISPVGSLTWKGQTIVVNNNETGPIAHKLFAQVTGLQYGTVKDTHGWVDSMITV
jgi:branched-chain amino acid aminotransferase